MVSSLGSKKIRRSIPDTDHVARHVGSSRVPGGIPTGSAFMPREDEAGLSVNWLQKLTKNKANQIAALRRRLAEKGRGVGKNDWLLVLRVGTTRMRVLDELIRSLNFVHVPEPNDNSHSEIQGYTHLEAVTSDLIADTVTEVHRARS